MRTQSQLSAGRRTRSPVGVRMKFSPSDARLARARDQSAAGDRARRQSANYFFENAGSLSACGPHLCLALGCNSWLTALCEKTAFPGSSSARGSSRLPPCRSTPPTPLRIARDIDTRVKTSTLPSAVESRSGISDGGSRYGVVRSPGKSKPSEAQHPLRSEPREGWPGEEREWERAADGERWQPRASPSGSSIGTLARCSASARRERRCKTVSTSARTSTATPATRHASTMSLFPRSPR